MIITAKFASVCPCCNVRITEGSKVEWTKGSKARHAACAGSAVTAAPAPATRGSRIEASRRAWGVRRGMGSGHGMGSMGTYCTDNASCHCYDCQ